MSDSSVIRIAPQMYVHVLDTNENTTRVLLGPTTFTKRSHEELVFGPAKMVVIPPGHFCYVLNPVVKKDGAVVMENGIPKCKFSDYEVRFTQEPFPLYPGEQLSGEVQPLHVVAENSALRLRATRDFTEGGVERRAGDEWLFPGPRTYKPRVEVEVVETVSATLIKANQALKLRARKACTDKAGVNHQVAEEWLMRDEGLYLPDIDEQAVEVVNAHILTDTKALHLRALRTFKDYYGRPRKAGEEWLIDSSNTATHIVDVYEQLVQTVSLTTLTNRQYCVIVDPYDANGQQQLGRRVVVKGPKTFFLKPGEKTENGIQNAYILTEQQALLLKAREGFTDAEGGKPKARQPGDRWMITGPCDYFPPTQVDILATREALPLDVNEGIYVRDTRTGRVRSVIGQTYLLRENEELWAKELPESVEQQLSTAGGPRDKTRVVTYRVPHNAAVQIFDYKKKSSRVMFGPALVMLEPDEQFTQLSLSGGKPKRAHQIRTIVLLLGPDFMTDIVTVETSDHARLSLQLSYNWQFVPKKDKKDPACVFTVPDFVGDVCKAIASRVRGAVASVPFDAFHKSSAKIIRAAVFGNDPATGKIREEFPFPANNLIITNIDIQNVEPVDQRTRDSLQRAVQMAIEITTSSLEAAATHEAKRVEQAARGELERQKIADQALAETARNNLLRLQALSAATLSQGQATSEAKARAEASQIEGESAVEQAGLQQEAQSIEFRAQLASMTAHQEAEIGHQTKLDQLEIEKAGALADIETVKFRDMVKAIGAKTIKKMAEAGPEMQAKLLSSLGLQGYLVTDGNSPINLFNTANGLLGGAAAAR